MLKITSKLTAQLHDMQADQPGQPCIFCNKSPQNDYGNKLCDYCEKHHMCRRCEKVGDDVEERYSFGSYAGVLCVECAIQGFRDHCGIGGRQGSEQELDEYGPNDGGYHENESHFG